MLNQYPKAISGLTYLVMILFLPCLLLSSGCKTSTSTDQVSQNEEDKAESVKRSSESNPTSEKETGDGETITHNGSKTCSNPYYPINTNIERAYKLTGSAPASYSLNRLRTKMILLRKNVLLILERT